jgi:hypothetical protein
MKKQIVEILEHLAIYYRETLSPIQLAMYAEDLSCLTPEQLAKAVKTYRQNPQNKFFPIPAALIAVIRPVETELDDGQDIASRVIGAVAKFGSYQGEKAREYIGEVGWECVKRMGGWVGICSELTEENKGTLFAQIRGLSVTLKKKSANGTIATPQDWPDMLPNGHRNDQSIESREISRLISDSLNRK